VIGDAARATAKVVPRAAIMGFGVLFFNIGYISWLMD